WDCRLRRGRCPAFASNPAGHDLAAGVAAYRITPSPGRKASNPGHTPFGHLHPRERAHAGCVIEPRNCAYMPIAVEFSAELPMKARERTDGFRNEGAGGAPPGRSWQSMGKARRVGPAERRGTGAGAG